MASRRLGTRPVLEVTTVVVAGAFLSFCLLSLAGAESTLRELGAAYIFGAFAGILLSIAFLAVLLVRPDAALAILILSFPFLVRWNQLVSFDVDFFFVSIETVLIILLFVATAFHLTLRGEPITVETNVATLFVGLVAFSIVAAMLSTNVQYGFAVIAERYVVPSLLFVSATSLIRTKSQFMTTVWALIASAAVASAYAIVQFVSIGSGADYRVVSVYYSPNIMATMLITAVPLSVGAMLFYRNSWLSIVSAVTFAAVCVALVFSETRGVLLGLAGYLVLLPYHLKKSRRTYWLILAVAVSLTMSLSPQLKEALSRRPGFAMSVEGSSTSERWLAAASSLMIIRDHPLGVGPGMFVNTYPSYIMVGADKYLEDAHNLFLNTFVESGVGGGICLLLLFYQILRIAWPASRQNRIEGQIGTGIFFALVLFGVSGVTTGEQFAHLHMANVAYNFWVLAALAAILRKHSYCWFDGNDLSASLNGTKAPTVPLP